MANYEKIHVECLITLRIKHISFINFKCQVRVCLDELVATEFNTVYCLSKRNIKEMQDNYRSYFAYNKTMCFENNHIAQPYSFCVHDND